jgi:hypothetical protein
MTRRRWAAAAALLLALTIADVPRGLVSLVALPLALGLAWLGLLRRGVLRAVALAAALALAGATVLALVAAEPLLVAAAVAAPLAAISAARVAFHIHVTLPPAPAPRRAVLFYNPRSGGGKAERFAVAREASERGIEAVELVAGADLETLVRDAVAAGADALAMAGGDGSQAVVAAIAAEHGLPYACIPAGTRNHFALDLGVDRDDVVGALDALIDGGERLVDLADVNGLVFVNNVSLGVYADAVQKEGYRDAKLRTLLDTLPETLAGGANGDGLHVTGGDGRPRDAPATILVSNNRYRLGRAVGSGTRPRLDEGVLGVAVFSAPGAGGPPVEQWTAPSFDVEAGSSVAAGVDGEAVRLQPPLRFRAHPGVLHARIARAHPGASPSAVEPEGAWPALRALGSIAAGHPAEGA